MILNNPINDAKGNPQTFVPFKDGKPIFDNWSRGDVTIVITGDNNLDMKAARKQWELDFPGKPIPNDFTFHHDGLNTEIGMIDGKKAMRGRMQLVPKELNKVVLHEGSASMARGLYTLEKMTAKEVSDLASRPGSKWESIKTKVRSPRVKSFGRFAAVIFFADDVQNVGLARAGLNATPVLGDAIAIVEFPEQHRQLVAAASEANEDALNMPVVYATEKANATFAKFVPYELSTRSLENADLGKVESAMTRFYYGLKSAYRSEITTSVENTWLWSRVKVDPSKMGTTNINAIVKQFQQDLDSAKK